MQVELNYTRYAPGQKAVNYNYLEERKAIFTLPIKANNFSLFNRMTFNQIIMPSTKYSTAEWLISGAIFGVNTNLTNYAMFSEQSKPYTYSNLSFSLRLPGGYMVMPQTQFNYSQAQFISAKIGIEKYVFKNGFISLSYENNFLSKVQMAQFGFRYDFPFAQTGFTVRQSNSETTLMEVARGSLIMDAKTRYFGANNKTSVGKGALVFAPFLDLNCNGKRDPGEPKDYNMNIRISGGKPFQDDKDSTIRVLDLEPYTSYYVELDQNSFDNVAWKLQKKTMTVIVDPNQFKVIEVPISVVGEVSGTVYKKGKGEAAGLGRIVVNFFDKNSKVVGKTLTEPDGYFSYLGLAPGKYYAQVDTSQLKRVQMSIDSARLPFNIKQSRDGDIVEGIDFTLTSLKAEEEPLMPDLSKEQLAQTDKSRESAAQADKTKVTPAQSVTDADKNTLASAEASKKAQQKALADKAISKTAVDKTLGVTPAGQTTGKSATDKAAGKPAGIPVTIAGTEASSTYLQVGAFKSKINAEKLAQSLSKISQCPVVAIHDAGFYKVRLGGFKTESLMLICKNVILTNGYFKEDQIFVVQATTETSIFKAPEAIAEVPAAQKKADVPVTKPIGTNPAETKPADAKQIAAIPAEAKPADAKPVTVPAETKPVPTTPAATKPDTSQKTAIAKAPAAPTTIVTRGKQYFVQVGAFIDQKNAKRVATYLSHAVPYKVQIVVSGMFSKVRLGGFSTSKEAEDCIRLMDAKGIENKESVIVELDVISTTTISPTVPNTAVVTTPPTSGNDATSTLTKTVATPPVSTLNATPPASKSDADTTPQKSASTPKVVVASSGPTIQLGLFQDKDNALKCVEKMASEAPYPIKMVVENGKYAVRFGPFANISEAQNCLNLLKKKGLNCFIKL
jgi:cell division protein FtsN